MRKASLVLGVLAAGAATVGAATVASADSHPAKPALVRAAPTFTDIKCQGVSDGGVVSFGEPVVNQQPVVASAVEGSGDEFFGDAHVWAEGVAVHQNLVQVRVHTGWGAPLSVCVHIIG